MSLSTSWRLLKAYGIWDLLHMQSRSESPTCISPLWVFVLTQAQILQPPVNTVNSILNNSFHHGSMCMFTCISVLVKLLRAIAGNEHREDDKQIFIAQQAYSRWTIATRDFPIHPSYQRFLLHNTIKATYLHSFSLSLSALALCIALIHDHVSYLLLRILK